MTNTKLLALLRTFKTKDFRRFREYLASPFFNKREDLVRFYAVLEQESPEFSPSHIKKEYIWEQYAGPRPLDEKEMAYLMNFLLKHAENFIAIEKVEKDESTKGALAMAYYLEHGLSKHYKTVFQRTRLALEKESYRDADWHLRAWRLAYSEVQHFYSFPSRKPDNSLTRANEHLDAFYLDKRLELSGEIINLNQILEDRINTQSIEELLAFLETSSTSEPSVQIRKLVLKILWNPNDLGSFHKLRQILPATTQVFPPEKVKGIFAYAQNFCIRRIKTGDQAFQQELFGIYQESIQAGAIFEGEFFNPWNFKNVCSIALKLKEYQWMETFIEEYGDRLPPEFRTSTVAYNKANLHFHQREYDQALKALTQVEFSDIFYALDTRKMQLMIYFEREDHEALASLISSFRIFLRRNRVASEKNRKAYKHFLDWVTRIFRAIQKGAGSEIEEFIPQILATKPLVEGEWLVEKCRGMKQQG